jgi:hypothetical protein
MRQSPGAEVAEARCRSGPHKSRRARMRPALVPPETAPRRPAPHRTAPHRMRSARSCKLLAYHGARCMEQRCVRNVATGPRGRAPSATVHNAPCKRCSAERTAVAIRNRKPALAAPQQMQHATWLRQPACRVRPVSIGLVRSGAPRRTAVRRRCRPSQAERGIASLSQSRCSGGRG